MPTEIETQELKTAEHAAFEKWAFDRWKNSLPPEHAWTGWKARAYLAALDSPIGEQGVGVKALEWRCVGNGIWEAGHHQVWHQWASDGLWYSSVNVGHRKIERIGDGFKSLEEAQSACQADFNRRIRADLSPERKEPVAVIGSGWQLLWASPAPLAEIVKRTGISIGTALYATPEQPT